jgi:hypothetical protein
MFMRFCGGGIGHKALREVEHLLRHDNNNESGWEDIEQDIEMGDPLSEISLPDIYTQEQGTRKNQDEDSEGDEDDDYGYAYNDNRTDSDDLGAEALKTERIRMT